MSLSWHSNLGPAAIQELCTDLDTAGPDRKARAEFALQNVALSVTKQGAERERLQYVSALAGALERHPSDRAASFILAQLQLTGRGESIAPASRFLNDPHLCEPAAQAMVAIREGADAAFLSALPRAEKECRITIIQSLGVLRSSRAVDALRDESASEDSGIRRAALEALENIEAPRAGSDSLSAAARGRATPAGAGNPAGPGAGAPAPDRALGPESADSILAIAETA
ncbi:MAG: hypothetical protein H6Q29_1498, partial [Bacteroidetes bacterium]|nr:hypothetical protein [Bacteroidota bacterium]